MPSYQQCFVSPMRPGIVGNGSQPYFSAGLIALTNIKSTGYEYRKIVKQSRNPRIE